MTIDEAIAHALEVAERQEYLSHQNYGYCEEKRNVEAREQCAECAADHRQLAEWLTELKEWKENPFRQIKAECKENYYCNNCAFIDHCPFSNGNRVAAEYPMDWVTY